MSEYWERYHPSKDEQKETVERRKQRRISYGITERELEDAINKCLTEEIQVKAEPKGFEQMRKNALVAIKKGVLEN